MVIQKTITSFSNHSSAISTSSSFPVSNEKTPVYCWDHISLKTWWPLWGWWSLRILHWCLPSRTGGCCML